MVGSMGTLFFTDGEVRDFSGAMRSDRERFGRYFRSMLEQGIYLPPSQFEAAFLSVAHTEEDIGRTVEAHRRALRVAFA